MDFKEEKELIQRYLSGSGTEAERQRLEDWYVMRSKEFPDQLPLPDYEQLNDEIWYGVERRNESRKQVQLWRNIAAAAVVFICVTFGFYFFTERILPDAIVTAKKDIPPGDNKAFLTLANGNRIALTDMKNGEVAVQSGVRITKTADGQLVYRISDSDKSRDKLSYNIIETPNGGQYRVILPDGTSVWLNAATSLKYPSTFTRQENRKVELLSGEAYFEVAKDKKHPFVVKTANQEIEVLGTHFNINSYTDEPAVKTTLLEGRVKVTGITGSKIIDPGYQTVNSESGIDVEKVDTENILDWKNNDFVFNGVDFKTAMRKVARWYDVEIVYDAASPKDVEIGGWISRKNRISAVLKLIESTGQVHFKIEGRRVFVKK